MGQEPRLRQHTLGYLEIQPRPSAAEIQAFYRDQYFGSDRADSQYATTYTADELAHVRLSVEESLAFTGPTAGQVYEVGYGEGFALAGFRDAGWRIGGVDFTADGVELHNPSIRHLVEVGDVFERLEELAGAGQTFDALLCNNVLEHVLDPERLSQLLHALTAPGGLSRVVVPNDGSLLQGEVVRQGFAEADYWVAYPDHLNYFGPASLRALLESTGWEVIDLLGTFPIDLFLLNPDSNYEADRQRGKNCHRARVLAELAIAEQGIDALIAFRRGCADAGIGRDLVAYVRRPAG